MLDRVLTFPLPLCISERCIKTKIKSFNFFSHFFVRSGRVGLNTPPAGELIIKLWTNWTNLTNWLSYFSYIAKFRNF